MMVERLALGEHPLRQALAYDSNAIASVAVGVVEITSLDHRQAKRRKKCGRDHAQPGTVMLLAVGWNMAIGAEFEREIVIAIAPRDGRADRNVLNTRQFADSPHRFPVKRDDLGGRLSLVHYRHVHCEHMMHFEGGLRSLKRKQCLYKRAGRH